MEANILHISSISKLVWPLVWYFCVSERPHLLLRMIPHPLINQNEYFEWIILSALNNYTQEWKQIKQIKYIVHVLQIAYYHTQAHICSSNLMALTQYGQLIEESKTSLHPPLSLSPFEILKFNSVCFPMIHVFLFVFLLYSKNRLRFPAQSVRSSPFCSSRKRLHCIYFQSSPTFRMEWIIPIPYGRIFIQQNIKAHLLSLTLYLSILTCLSMQWLTHVLY